MPRPLIDEAGLAHNCQANARYRIRKGEKRLKVRNGRTLCHYCLNCEGTVVERDIAKLGVLLEELKIG